MTKLNKLRLTKKERTRKEKLTVRLQELKEKDRRLQGQEENLLQSRFETGRLILDEPLENRLKTYFDKVPIYAGQGCVPPR